jgi:hypothetical protein
MDRRVRRFAKPWQGAAPHSAGDLRPYEAGGGGAHALRMKTSHRRLAAFTGVNAVAAWAGAAGLMTGYLALEHETEARLPFESPAFGGVALALVVAVPLSGITALAWGEHAATRTAASVCGALLVGWIITELLFIRELSFLHPFYFAVGTGLFLWGRFGDRSFHHRATAGRLA